MKEYNLAETFVILLLMGALSMISNTMSSHVGILEAIPGMLILIAICMAGIALGKYMPGHIPGVAYVVTLGCILTCPGFPGADIINFYMKKVGFVALCTVILAYAGVSIGKDMDAFRHTGWRIMILSCVIFMGTYLGSAIIAQVILKAIGQI
ncbi:MAG: DUF340 domain-containing protein [Acidaminococcus sp.]|jgi:uncharacterized membrane protein YkgB|nr:DUF340 domain-containing protein [Acidaminococcus sp.]MCI2100085.1 DUF340 domain-containing protein [Acidaminococcus sp.]MCI2114362.1 DUF340 domain-containing protein [Acidaminococcus sp.]MCI2116333.1 DUF340 domain-containing protein [Acidaminococcus sp.]